MTVNDTLERDLRDGLAAQAARLPAASAERLHNPRVAVAARPAAGRRRPLGRALRLSGAALAATGAAAYLAVALPGATPAAFASWTSSPSPLPPGALAGVEQVCGQTHAPAITDVRGNSVYAVFAGAATRVDCLAPLPGHPADRGLRKGPWITETPVAATAPASTGPSGPSPAEPVVLLSVKPPEGNAVHAGRFTWVSGQAAPTISRIVVTTTGGTVEASVRAGRFAAWWPGNDGDTARIVGYDAAGRAVTVLSELSCGSGAVEPRVATVGYAPRGGC